MTAVVYGVECFNENDQIVQHDQFFTTLKQANRMKEALNAGLEPRLADLSEKDRARYRWSVYSIPLIEDEEQEYYTEFSLQITSTIFAGDLGYFSSTQPLTTVKKVEEPLREDTYVPPSASWGFWNIHVHGSSLEEVDRKAAEALQKLNQTGSLDV